MPRASSGSLVVYLFWRELGWGISCAASVTCVSQGFLERAGLMGLLRPQPDGVQRRLKMPNGTVCVSTGVIDL